MCKQTFLQERTSASCKQQRLRRVTFGDDESPRVSIHTFERIAQEDRPNVFMARREEQRVRDNAVMVAEVQSAIYGEDTYSSSLLMAYDTRLGKRLRLEAATQLAKHITLQPECRGLERSFAEGFDEKLDEDRTRAIRGVLDMHGTLSSGERVAETYRRRSEASVNFSIMMGHIDAVVARKGDTLYSAYYEEQDCYISNPFNGVAGLCEI